MWCRFLTFCVLVSFILFVVASCIYGRPSFHLFFHRCCGDDIENDQVIYENFGNNFLKERLVGGDIIEVDNETVFENEDIGRITDEMKEVLSINDPEVKKWFMIADVSDSATSDTIEDRVAVEELYDGKEGKKEDEVDAKNDEQIKKEVESVTEIMSTLSNAFIDDKIEAIEIYEPATTTGQNLVDEKVYDLLNKETEEETESSSKGEFLNVHDWMHKLIAKTV